MSARAWLRSPWPFVVLGPVALALAVAFARFGVTLAIISATGAAVLVWKFGLREGLWYLLLLSIPLREPLSVDVVGTVSVFPTDILLFVLFATAIGRDGLRTTWRASPSFKIGLAILVLSLPGLVTASRLLFGVNALYQFVAQLGFLFVARSMVRSGRDAQKVLVAIVVGMIPVVVYGFYQASLPYGADLPDWSPHYIAWDALGDKSVRVFSTFRHPVHLAHYISVGMGLSLGLAMSSLNRPLKWFLLLVGAAAALCSLFTSSIGGLLGMLSAVVATIVLQRRRRILVLAPLLFVALLWFAPPAMTAKLGLVITGRSTSGAARLVTYSQSLVILRDNPILGVGWGGTRSAFEHDHRVTRADAVAFVAENYFLQRGVALGLPGIVLSVLLCILFFRNAFLSRSEGPGRNWPRAAILIAGVAFYVHAQSFPAVQPTGTYILWTLFGLAERMRENSVAMKGVA
ncbi:O-antigen ligase family protein [bacterium]|nr:O-antigen ligase family protein [bacterium]